MIHKSMIFKIKIMGRITGVSIIINHEIVIFIYFTFIYLYIYIYIYIYI